MTPQERAQAKTYRAASDTWAYQACQFNANVACGYLTSQRPFNEPEAPVRVKRVSLSIDRYPVDAPTHAVEYILEVWWVRCQDRDNYTVEIVRSIWYVHAEDMPAAPPIREETPS